ncbi:MAG: hypothetical protein ACT4RN_18060 [Pseudonocardia sp.]
MALTDSRTFSRTFTAASLLLGSVLFVVQPVVDPAWADDPAAYLDAIAAAPGRYQLAGLISVLGSFLLLVGFVGVFHLLRTARLNLGQIGTGLLFFGTVVLAGFYPIAVIEATATRPQFDRAQMSAMLDQAQNSPWALLFPVAWIGGFALGSLLLAVGLFLRRPAVPVWVPAVLVVAIVVGFLGQTQLLAVASSVLLAAALVGLALRIIAVTDEQWGACPVLPQRPRAERARPADPAAPAPAG